MGAADAGMAASEFMHVILPAAHQGLRTFNVFWISQKDIEHVLGHEEDSPILEKQPKMLHCNKKGLALVHRSPIL
jgi:hypothetical protein